jgi:hypothetical protein
VKEGGNLTRVTGNPAIDLVFDNLKQRIINILWENQ